MLVVAVFPTRSWTVNVTVVAPGPTSVPAAGDCVITSDPALVQLSEAVRVARRSGMLALQFDPTSIVAVAGALTVGGTMSTVSVPVPSAKSFAPFEARTLKGVAPRGVAPVEVNVSVEVREVWDELNESEAGENEAVTPAGSAVVTASVAVKFPLDPDPVPRLTVTTSVTEELGQS